MTRDPVTPADDGCAREPIRRTLSSRTRITIVIALALFAFARTAAGALSFPLFGHLDELSHLDTVFKYRDRFSLPENPSFESEITPYFALHNSPEYALAPDADGVRPRGSDLPFPSESALALHLEPIEAGLRNTKNHQTYEAPLYYWFGAQWLALGRALGIGAPSDGYWVRMLGAFALSLAVLLSYAFAREVANSSDFLAIGVPALVAAWPQDIYYFLNNDHLSIVLGAAALVMLARFYTRGNSSVAKWATTSRTECVFVGLTLGLAIAHKQGNLTIAAAAIPLTWPSLRATILTRDRSAAVRLAIVGAATALPIACSRFALHARTGYWDGAALKCDWLNVSNHDIGGMLAHPIWSAGGAWTFLSELSGSFWRGETRWHGELMHDAWSDFLWMGTAVAFVSAAAFVRPRPEQQPARAVRIACVLAVLSGVAILAWASIAWNYGANTYPSSDFPFLVSGRVISGMAPAMFLLYAVGLGRVCGRFRWLALGAILVTLLGSELNHMIPVASSPHNFWHQHE